jgi:drug/metabolite transporter (DMT)-like permease
MSATVVLFALMDATAKYLSQTLPVLQIVWARYVLFLFVALAPAAQGGFLGLARTRRPALQVFRSAFLVGFTLCALAAYSFMPLAEVNAIGSTAPLLVTILSAVVLREDVRIRRWSAIVAGFVGTLIVARPGLGVMHWAAILLLGAATLYASYQIATRVLAASDGAATSLFYSGTVGALVPSAVVPFVRVPPSLQGWLPLGLVGLLGTAAHLCIIRAPALAPASTLQPYA